MIKINNTTYSGNLVPSNDADKIKVMLYTITTIQDLSVALDHANSVIETDVSGTEKSYTTTDVISVSRVSDNVYMAEFSTKPTVIQELSNAIDALLVMLLEG